jgi:hypothetical protein
MELGTVLLLLGLAVAFYLAILIVPVYFDNMDIRQELGNTFLQQGKLKTETEIHDFLVRRLGTLGSHYEPDEETGELLEVPGILVDDEQVTVIRDPAQHTLLLQISYDREVKLIPSNKVLNFHFEPKFEDKLSP